MRLILMYGPKYNEIAFLFFFFIKRFVINKRDCWSWAIHTNSDRFLYKLEFLSSLNGALVNSKRKFKLETLRVKREDRLKELKYVVS